MKSSSSLFPIEFLDSNDILFNAIAIGMTTLGILLLYWAKRKLRVEIEKTLKPCHAHTNSPVNTILPAHHRLLTT